MTKKFAVLYLILLLPVILQAQETVTFDFNEYIQEDAVPSTFAKDGILLKFKSLSIDEDAAEYKKVKIESKKINLLRLNPLGVLTVDGDRCKIVSIKFKTSAKFNNLTIYSDGDGKIENEPKNSRTPNILVKIWKGEAYSISFKPRATKGVEIISMTISYKKIPTEDVLLSVSSAERATLYYGKKSFKIPNGVTARTYKIIDNVLTKSKVYTAGDVLPKATAVVLEAKEGKYLFEETKESGVADTENVLRGSDTRTVTTGGDVYYMFSNGSNGVGFYWKEPDGKSFMTEAHKAYLAYSPSTARQAKSFLGFDISLGIRSDLINSIPEQDVPVYNLSGQRVNRNYKGIIVVNGKKFFNK